MCPAKKKYKYCNYATSPFRNTKQMKSNKLLRKTIEKYFCYHTIVPKFNFITSSYWRVVLSSGFGVQWAVILKVQINLRRVDKTKKSNDAERKKWRENENVELTYPENIQTGSPFSDVFYFFFELFVPFLFDVTTHNRLDDAEEFLFEAIKRT